MRLLHTMLRVGDFATLHRFLYQSAGHETAAYQRKPEYKYSLKFVGYGPETEEAVIELTYNWGG